MRMRQELEKITETLMLEISDSHNRVVAAISLGATALWSQVSSLVQEEIAKYVQMPKMRLAAPVVIVSSMPDSGMICSAHGDEIFVGGNQPVAVYRDGVCQRRIDGSMFGSAVVDATLFTVSNAGIGVYPLAGGAVLRSFGASGPGRLHGPWGVAAVDQRILVAEHEAHRVTIFEEDGAFIAQAAGVASPRGVAVANGMAFVSGFQDVVVYNTRDLSLERRIGKAFLYAPQDVSVADGLLFVSDRQFKRVVVFDAANGSPVAVVAGFFGDFAGCPFGVAVREDGVLFVAARDTDWSLYTVTLA